MISRCRPSCEIELSAYGHKAAAIRQGPAAMPLKCPYYQNGLQLGRVHCHLTIKGPSAMVPDCYKLVNFTVFTFPNFHAFFGPSS